MPHTSRLAELLLNIGAVNINVKKPYKWSSGLLSPVYCDLRMLYGHPQARALVIQAFITRIDSLHIQPDAIASTEANSIGWGALIADRLDLPFAIVRRKPKSFGSKKQVEGDSVQDKHVLIVDELVSTGDTAVIATNALREAGAIVTDMVSIFTFEMEKSLEKAQELGIRLHALSTFGIVLDIAVDQGRLEEALLSKAQEFSDDRENWQP